MTSGTLSPEAMARLNAAIRHVTGRDPRYRYFECRTCKAMFMWTTERMGDDKFASAHMVPYGKGSRSGDPQGWRTTKEVHTPSRTRAKARALALFNKHQADVAAGKVGHH